VRKALVTIGAGPAAELLDLSRPTFRAYADRHGYDLIEGAPEDANRAPSWWKIPLVCRLLDSYDFVLWVDADTLILDPTVDVETVIPPDAFQAFATVELKDRLGNSPCGGVWAFRAGERTQRFLDAIWAQDDLIGHRWWEQAALMRLLGWSLDYPITKNRPSEWDDGTFLLSEEWDMIPVFPIGYASGRIRHFAGWPYRRRKFDMRTDLARLNGNLPRYWLGVLERNTRSIYGPALRRLRGR
jgi:hypothetical protein